MKKTILIGIALISLLASCKKDVTCLCSTHTISKSGIHSESFNTIIIKNSTINKVKQNQCADKESQDFNYYYALDSLGHSTSVVLNDSESKTTCQIK